MSSKPRLIYEFGPFRLDPEERLLLRDGEPVRLKGKPFEALVALVEGGGRLVEKDELLRGLWPEQPFVEEANLTNHISTLRKALGDDPNDPDYVQTVSGHGYRFVAGVRGLEVWTPPEEPRRGSPDAAQGVLLVEKRTRTSTYTEEEVLPGGGPEPRPAGALPGGEKTAPRRAAWRMSLALSLLCVAALAGLSLLRGPSGRGEARRAEAGSAAAGAPRAVAVLPFKIIGPAGGDEEEYLGLGITDALVMRLGRNRGLVVRPTSAVRRYANAETDPVAAGREQGVEAVLDGSVQRAGERIRLNVRLLRVGDGSAVWSGQFDEKFTDFFAVQDAISRRVAEGLSAELAGEGRARGGDARGQNVEAYEEYLKGRYFWNKRTKEGFEKALKHFGRAVSLDPTYARAYAGLADAQQFLGAWGDPAEVHARARASALRAVELDPTLAEPHASLGLIAMNFDWDWATAEREFRVAVELDPNYPTAHHWYAEYLAAVGRGDDSVAEITRARELDPLSIIINADAGKMLYFARRYDEAIAQLRQTLEMDGNFAVARVHLGLAYAGKGHYREAVAVLEAADRTNWYVKGALGYVYGLSGRTAEARRLLGELLHPAGGGPAFFEVTTLVYLGLGEKEHALDNFERQYRKRGVGLTSLKVNPMYDCIRDDPRYADLIRRVGLPQ